jgi:hypothetical protein
MTSLDGFRFTGPPLPLLWSPTVCDHKVWIHVLQFDPFRNERTISDIAMNDRAVTRTGRLISNEEVALFSVSPDGRVY